MQQSGEDQRVRPPVPSFDEETAKQKIKAAQDAWNTVTPRGWRLDESERRYRWERPKVEEGA